MEQGLKVLERQLCQISVFKINFEYILIQYSIMYIQIEYSEYYTQFGTENDSSTLPNGIECILDYR